jgi:hypothetical protein
MVRMFRRLDVVEEAAINHSLPRRRNRRDEVGGLVGFDLGHSSSHRRDQNSFNSAMALAGWRSKKAG